MLRTIRIVPALIIFAYGLLSGIFDCHAGTEKQIFYAIMQPEKTVVSFFNDMQASLVKEQASFDLINLNFDTLPAGDNALYIAAGNRSFEYLLEQKTKSPILAIFISRLSFHQLVEKHAGNISGQKISAIFSDPSPIQQLYLTKYLFPKPPKTAAIVSDRTAFLKPELQAASIATGIPLQILEFTENVNVSKILHEIESADVILALPDSSLYNRNTIQRIILSAYRRNQSIIGFSRQFVDAGGLATVYSDATHIQNELVDALNQYLKKGIVNPPGYPKLFDIKINTSVSDSYNLVLPEIPLIKKRIMHSLEACCEK